jgi:hypothetical protein
MRYSRLVPIAAAVILVVTLLGVSGADVRAAQRGNELCVAVSGGTVVNETVIDVVADGGTAIGDASGGNGNVAFTANGGNENARDNGNNNGNNNNGNNNRRDNNGNGRNNNRNDWSAQPLDVLEQRLLQTDTASSGNGGVADASANGGVVSIGDINSGGNAGNAISVGDTHCAGAAPQKPSGGGGGYAAPSGGGGGGGRGGKVKALPNTGVGATENGASESLLLALGALGFVILSLGYGYDRQVSRVAGR